MPVLLIFAQLNLQLSRRLDTERIQRVNILPTSFLPPPPQQKKKIIITMNTSDLVTVINQIHKISLHFVTVNTLNESSM